MTNEFELSFTGSEINHKLSQISELATKSELPSRTSQLTNDSGFITEYIETDPTVPAWAKAPNKPTYTADEVGALSNTTVIPTVPSNVSAFTNDAGYLTEHQSLQGIATETYVNSKISTINIPDVAGQLENHNTTTSAHSDIRTLISNLNTELDSHGHDISDVTSLQTALNNKANSSHTHTVSQISDLTVTATELNYIDGVTSNIQTQLNGKAATTHTHSHNDLILTDTSTGTQYKLTVTSGKLTLNPVV